MRRITRASVGASIAAAVTAAAAGGFLLAGCSGSPQLDDLKGINPLYPDYAVVVMAPDGFPNYVIACYDGQATLSTTRNYTAIAAAPQYDNICRAHPRNDLTPVNGYTPPPGQ